MRRKTRGGEIPFFNLGNERVAVSVVQIVLKLFVWSTFLNKEGVKVQNIYSESVIFTLGRLFLQNCRVKGIAAGKHSVLTLKMLPEIQADAWEKLWNDLIPKGQTSVPDTMQEEMMDSHNQFHFCLGCFSFLSTSLTLISPSIPLPPSPPPRLTEGGSLPQ